jgi:short-subunit dehydrogenase
MPQKTERRAALVTGASYGIGAATAIALRRTDLMLLSLISTSNH